MISSLAACLLFSASSIFLPASPEYLAQKFNLDYPVAQLGGCSSPSSCAAYCAEPSRATVCAPYLEAFAVPPPPSFDPSLLCTQTSGCSWTGTTCQCAPPPTPTYYYLPLPTPIVYPTPTSTSGPSSSSGSGSSTPTTYPTPTYYYYYSTPTPFSTPQPSATSATPTPTTSSSGSGSTGTCIEPTGGCGSYKYWDSASCSCKSMEDICRSTSGCSWTGTTCQCTNVQSATTSSISFPIPELGSCNSCSSCSQFCATSPSNRNLCLGYIARLDPQPASPSGQTLESDLFAATKKELGCTSQKSCQDLCQKPQYQNSCQNFVRTHDLIPDLPLTPPQFLTRFLSSTTGSQDISLAGLPKTSIDLYLQSLDFPTEPIFITRLPVASSRPLTYSWSTLNHPSGRYQLLAKTVQGTSLSPTVAALDVTLTHPAPSSSKDIVFPSQFDPKSVPTSKTLAVSKVQTVAAAANQSAIRFSGRATPGSTVTLLIYSQPIVVTVTADANGVWHYDLQKPLSPGNHTAYVAVSTSAGAKIRSEAANFSVIPSAAAAEGTTSPDSFIVASVPSATSTNRWLIAAAAIITVTTFLFFLYLLRTSAPSELP